LRTGCGSNCGSCLDMAAELIEQARVTRDLPLPLLALVTVG
jgi:bacterioferritin-associated ferredoxin